MARRSEPTDDPASPPADPSRGEASIPDPEPWEEARRDPASRPRHESAAPEDADDPDEASAAIAAESWGELVELESDETVDGDYNGAPELAGLDETRAWEGDAVEAMEATSEEVRDEMRPGVEDQLLEELAERREILAERLDEARALGLGERFETALAVSDPGERPVVPDPDELREELARIDAALEQLERRAIEGG